MVYFWNIENNENKRAIFSPLNGSEPDYEPEKWNNKINIRKTHNCYAYMFDIIGNFKSKPQPGYNAGYFHMSDSDIRSCDKVMERIRADNPSVIPSSFKAKCPNGYRKGYFAIDAGEDPDYHFYRLDKTGLWSHKPGSTKVRSENFNGKLIIRPDKARRESNSHRYDKSCGYYCFDPKQSIISDEPKKK